METDFTRGFIKSVILLPICLVVGCGNKSDGQESPTDAKLQSQAAFGSQRWNTEAAENITVRIVVVLRRPDTGLRYSERGALRLTDQEKEVISANGITGELEVVYNPGRGTGSREVRVVIIQSRPLKADARLPVPEAGSSIYIEREGILKPLAPTPPASSLTLELREEKKETMFFLDYPRDGVRYGGSLFWWDENGKWHPL
jgi:hypothetical protein